MIIINYDILYEVLEDEEKIDLVNDIYNDLCKNSYYSDTEFYNDLEEQLLNNDFDENKIEEIKTAFEVRL